MANPFAATGINLFGNLLSGTITLIGILLIGGVILGAFWYVKYIRQFDIKVEILSTRANIGGVDQHKIFFDTAGYLWDREAKMFYFRIRKLKVDLPSPPFNVLIPTDKGNMVKIWQKSQDEFVFLLPDKIDTSVVVRQDGKTYSSANLNMKQVEGDVAYWNVKRKDRNKKLFDPESIWMKMLPFIVPMLMFVLVIFITWMVLKNFSVLQGVADSLQETARILKGGATPTITG